MACLTLVLALGLVSAAFAEPAADCNGQLNIRYISGPAYGVNGSVYRIELGLGTGTITGGAANTLSLSTVRFFLDCTFSGLPGCTDDGNVVNYVGNITTTCGTAQPGFWTPSVGANAVDFTAASPIVIPALQPAFPGFCVVQFDIVVASASDAQNDTTPLRVEEIATYALGTCDNGLPSAGSQSAAFDLCQVCNDNNACTADACNTTTGQCAYTPNVVCNDNNLCTADACNPATGQCVYTPNVVCNDNDGCTADSCNPATGLCVYTPNVVCNDNDGCTADSCNPATGQCVYTPNVVCNDNDLCTADSCNPATGQCVYTPNVVCNDNDGCTSDRCVPATGQCEYTTTVFCDDNNECTDDACDPATGQCVYTPNDLCQEICRTPGYWATHAAPTKTGCSDVTGAVLAWGGGSMNICGECISNDASGHTLGAGNAASAVEAMCVAVRGEQARQLARQLTAAALNCIVSGYTSDCAGASIGDVFAACNRGCAVAVGNDPGPAPEGFNLGWCIQAIDCFNNGFGLPNELGCGESTGCHDRALPWDEIPRPEGCYGPAPASSDRCQAAKKNTCGVLPFDEGLCSADTCLDR